MSDELAKRKHALDLVPANAYWRPAFELEQKIDFAQFEAEEGKAIQTARLGLGMIFAGQMEAYALWLQTTKLTSNTAARVPMPLRKEVARQFELFYTTSHYEGAGAYRSWKARQMVAQGMPVRVPEMVGLSKAATNRLLKQADRTALEVCDTIRKKIAEIVGTAFAPNGLQLRPVDALVAEVRAYYANEIIEESSSPLAELAGRAMKVRDKAKHAEWQARHLPYTKWIKQTAAEIRASGKNAPQVRPGWATKILQTKRTETIGKVIAIEGAKDKECWGYVFSARRDAKTCSECVDRDGVTLPKEHIFWWSNWPPIHPRCRCVPVPVFKWEKFEQTPAREWKQIDDSAIPSGYGMVDKAAVKRAGKMRVTPPKPPTPPPPPPKPAPVKPAPPPPKPKPVLPVPKPIPKPNVMPKPLRLRPAVKLPVAKPIPRPNVMPKPITLKPPEKAKPVSIAPAVHDELMKKPLTVTQHDYDAMTRGQRLDYWKALARDRAYSPLFSANTLTKEQREEYYQLNKQMVKERRQEIKKQQAADAKEFMRSTSSGEVVAKQMVNMGETSAWAYGTHADRMAAREQAYKEMEKHLDPAFRRPMEMKLAKFVRVPKNEEMARTVYRANPEPPIPKPVLSPQERKELEQRHAEAAAFYRRFGAQVNPKYAVMKQDIRVEGPEARGWCRIDSKGRATIRHGYNAYYMATHPDTMVHEMGHAIEGYSPAINKAAKAFLDRRTKGEASRLLSEVTGNGGYDDTERCRPDKLIDPYIGKDYSGQRHQGYRSGATPSEVISMGMQYMFRNPQEFARKDPDHFALIWDCLTGRIR